MRNSCARPDEEFFGDLMAYRLGKIAVRLGPILIFSALASSSILAQIPGAMNETTATRLGGNSYVVGTVFWPTGSPVNTRIGIRLTSPTAGEYFSMTDEKGQFVFSGLVAGNYSIVIEGERDFESVTQQVEVLQSRSSIPQTYTVSIRLVDKAKLVRKPSVISASLAVPKSAADRYRKALEASKAGDHKAAVEHLKLAIAEYPGYVNAYNEMGVQYMRLNELDKADAALQTALKIKPDAFEPLLNCGITLFRLKRFADAEALLRSATGGKGQSAIAHYYLGRALTSLDRFEDAEKELNTALAIGGDEMKEAHRMLANLFIAKGDDKRAVDELETYLKLVPEAPDAENLRKVVIQLKTPRPAAPAIKPL